MDQLIGTSEKLIRCIHNRKTLHLNTKFGSTSDKVYKKNLYQKELLLNKSMSFLRIKVLKRSGLEFFFS
jgi:hypothetical protein